MLGMFELCMPTVSAPCYDNQMIQRLQEAKSKVTEEKNKIQCQVNALLKLKQDPFGECTNNAITGTTAVKGMFEKIKDVAALDVALDGLNKELLRLTVEERFYEDKLCCLMDDYMRQADKDFRKALDAPCKTVCHIGGRRSRSRSRSRTRTRRSRTRTSRTRSPY